MELEELFNKKLVAINRSHKKIELVFEGLSSSHTLRFEGFIFETELSPMDQKVLEIRCTYTLGIKATEVLRFYHEFMPNLYKQIYIRFEGFLSKKSELICVCKNYELR